MLWCTPPQAEASAQRGTLLAREKHKHAYDKALVQRYQHMPEIRRIVKHRHLPTAIYKVLPTTGLDLWYISRQLY